ncbi:MAG: hypothetical protein JST12_03730 [Armatimonadetes bacterium]|nr:hypothetical protein [Armatimonadota bacterium]
MMVRSLCWVGLATTALACGGVAVPGVNLKAEFSVRPESAAVATGGSFEIQVVSQGYHVDSYSFRLVEGADGGYLNVNPLYPNRAYYTAPSTPGTYHVEAGFVEDAEHTHLKTIDITVQ